MVGFALFLGLFVGICIEWVIQEGCDTDDINLYTGTWLVVLIALCIIAIFGFCDGWFKVAEKVVEVVVQ